LIAGRNNCQHVVSTGVADGCDRSLCRISKWPRADNCHGPRLALTRHCLGLERVGSLPMNSHADVVAGTMTAASVWCALEQLTVACRSPVSLTRSVTSCTAHRPHRLRHPPSTDDSRRQRTTCDRCSYVSQLHHSLTRSHSVRCREFM